MYQKWSNNAFSTVASAINNSATTLSVATGMGDRFPAVSGGDDFFLLTLQNAANDIEIVKVTARTIGSDSLTIVRGQDGTAARSWSIGDIVELRVTAAGLSQMATQSDPETLTNKTISTGSTWAGDPIGGDYGGIPAGTVMLFAQTTAPVGWTKQTTHNDKALRVVSGTAGSGGSTAFTTAFGTPAVTGTVGITGEPSLGNLAVSISGNVAVSNTTLSINQIPSHSHTIRGGNDSNPNGGVHGADQETSRVGNTGNAGGGGAHNHGANHNISGALNGTAGTGNLAGTISTASADINVQYVDVILAVKN